MRSRLNTMLEEVRTAEADPPKAGERAPAIPFDPVPGMAVRVRSLERRARWYSCWLTARSPSKWAR